MFSNTEDLLPVISFNAKASVQDKKKHQDFVQRMIERGYTEKQVRLLSEWYLRVRKSQWFLSVELSSPFNDDSFLSKLMIVKESFKILFV